jgi:mannose-6-phosphate isomerase-like protein (cupin superfamily)
VVRGSGAAEYFFAEGCYITELSNGPHDSGLSVARARVPAGVTTRWHRLHGIAERYVIVSGVGEVEVETLAPHRVQAGDVVIIPSGCRQRIANRGSDDLVFLAICTPRFRACAYVDVEESPVPPLR